MLERIATSKTCPFVCRNCQGSRCMSWMKTTIDIKSPTGWCDLIGPDLGPGILTRILRVIRGKP
jgi:hypothetical protein